MDRNTFQHKICLCLGAVILVINLAASRCLPDVSGVCGQLPGKDLQQKNVSSQTDSSTQSPSECTSQQYWYDGQCEPCGPLCAIDDELCSTVCGGYRVPVVQLSDDGAPDNRFWLMSLLGIGLLFITVIVSYICIRRKRKAQTYTRTAIELKERGVRNVEPQTIQVLMPRTESVDDP